MIFTAHLRRAKVQQRRNMLLSPVAISSCYMREHDKNRKHEEMAKDLQSTIKSLTKTHIPTPPPRTNATSTYPHPFCPHFSCRPRKALNVIDKKAYFSSYKQLHSFEMPYK